MQLGILEKDGSPFPSFAGKVGRNNHSSILLAATCPQSRFYFATSSMKRTYIERAPRSS
jgi:hypothetical protein